MSEDTLPIICIESEKVKFEYPWKNRKGKEKLSLRDTWALWLNEYAWDWWATFTFRDNVTAKAANKKWYKWLRIAENELGSTPGYFRVTETQKARQVLHFHALMLGVSRLRRLTYMDYWNRLSGFCRIYPYQKGRGAEHYLTKYVTKQLSDYKLGGCILRT